MLYSCTRMATLGVKELSRGHTYDRYDALRPFDNALCEDALTVATSTNADDATDNDL